MDPVKDCRKCNIFLEKRARSVRHNTGPQLCKALASSAPYAAYPHSATHLRSPCRNKLNFKTVIEQTVHIF